MRLLHMTEDESFALTRNYSSESEVPPYAILSHRWPDDGEDVVYDDIVGEKTVCNKRGCCQLVATARTAERLRVQYTWMDTCCIDKTKASDISEAIRSMYRWYERAEMCYVYLRDVSVSPGAPEMDHVAWRQRLSSSKWYTRGWVLQELLAPKQVKLFATERRDPGCSLQNLAKLSSNGHRFRQASGLPTSENAQKGRMYCLIWDNCDSVDRPDQYVVVRAPGLCPPEDESFQPGPTETRIKSLEEIKVWMSQERYSPTFWLRGVAGTGKSTIAQHMARKHNEKFHLGTIFFFSRSPVLWGSDPVAPEKQCGTTTYKDAQLLQLVPRVIDHMGGSIFYAQFGCRSAATGPAGSWGDIFSLNNFKDHNALARTYQLQSRGLWAERAVVSHLGQIESGSLGKSYHRVAKCSPEDDDDDGQYGFRFRHGATGLPSCRKFNRPMWLIDAVDECPDGGLHAMVNQGKQNAGVGLQANGRLYTKTEGQHRPGLTQSFGHESNSETQAGPGHHLGKSPDEVRRSVVAEAPLVPGRESESRRNMYRPLIEACYLGSNYRMGYWLETSSRVT